MELIFLSVLSLLGFVLAVFFFMKARQQQDQSALSDEREKLLQKQLEEARKENAILETKLEMQEKQRVSDLEQHQKDEATLKEQLNLLGQELVHKSSQVLRSENQQQLNQVLQPFKEKLELFEKEVKNGQLKENEHFTRLQTIIKGLSEQHLQMHNTAQNLADALRGDQKMQGDWGELALERILESSGLQRGLEYETQSTFRDENGSLLRPDVLIKLPENKSLIIDSKLSLVAYERFINEADPETKKKHLEAHLLSVKTHIRQLGEKNYSSLKTIDTPEFVLMFIPLESSFALAIKEEPSLYQLAWEKRVVLVTPSTLLATLKTVESIWKQERQNRHALDIADQAGRLYDKFCGFIADMESIGKKQADAQKAYDDAMKKLSSGSGNLVRSTEKLVQLGARAKKQLDTRFFLDDPDQDE
ncbi:MAG: DNA recombination protein RmuC [Bacteroidetes bacterium]|nr:MAG: DNA recombination protein RmuC [Bacteroidota bacterium]